ncbi:adenylate cyclase [Natronospira proteinivora]|uniref:Adenylate cyclase n=1 Tax=Natronospira proteinivora TaxID=1807133 RepID=A0ABT1G602_9GAMM|nr:adenylate/guanylate cyclase domain-containing protein [Natronospira proteinivora]MCP1726724.1 adenylate cyclase [Natronospira proteinivora]
MTEAGEYRRGTRRRDKRELRWRVLISATLLGLFSAHVSGLLPIGAISHLENLAYDSRLRATMPFSVDERIVIVGVDEPSLAQEGRWPWPRERIGTLVDRLFDRYGVRSVGLDIVFAEPQDGRRVSSAGGRTHGQWRALGGWLESGEQLEQEQTPDERLAEVLRGRPVTTAMIFRDASDARSVGVLPESVMRWEDLPQGLAPEESLSFTANLPVVADAAPSGFTDNVLLDRDGHYRRVPLFRAHRGEIYPSFALQMAWTEKGGKPRTLDFEHGGGSGLFSGHGLGLGENWVPMDRQAAVNVPFRGPRFSFSYLSAAEVLNESAPEDLLEDRIVLVGAWASRLTQVYATPVAQAMPSVEVQANILSGLLEGRVLHQAQNPVLAELTTLLLVAAILTAVFFYLGGWWAAGATLLILMIYSALNVGAWVTMSLVLPYASVALFIVSLFVLHLLYSQIIEARTRSQLSTVFGQYVPRELVDELSERPQNASLEGESRHMTVLFSDIHGFSGIAEALAPRELTRLMNEFLTGMTRVIQNHRGTIDKYMGDSVMAFWGAPLDAPDHARRAVLAALDMQREMVRLNRQFGERGWPHLRLGIGINTGHMSVGNMGSEFRMAYTVMGDAVNLGSRLEGLTRQYGVGIIASQFTRNAVPEVRFMELGPVAVRGREGPVTLYEPLGLPDQLSQQEQHRAERFEKALDALRAGRDWEVEMLVETLLVDDPLRHRLYRWLLGELRGQDTAQSGEKAETEQEIAGRGESRRENGL